MTKITPEAEAAVELTGRAWIKFKTESANMEARIRKRVEFEMETALDRSKLEVAQAIRVALEAGATKVAIRRVTSKNPGTIETFLELLVEHTEEVESKPIGDALQIQWSDDGLLGISLDPAIVVTTEYDRGDPNLWVGLFEVFIRDDGKVLIDPAGSTSVQQGAGITEWLRADTANEEAVIAWVTETPRAA